ncbi:MAG TPA: non-canonical purine NTP diphosphatase [Cytophagaceae bacterium]|jgi:XTP/dITP diphosphohydrolase|nr:non-canonical purine NTP diphosphatase [Cytophagaceae bacterium]
MKLCFATNNKNKIVEIKSILGDQFEILSLQEIGCNEELPETKDTIEGNSLQKAAYVWENYKVDCFSDDSGLEVLALNGEPGVYSAMYAGPACNAEDNMGLLLKKLEQKTDRSALFRTCITLIINGAVHSFEGTVKGTILKVRQGEKGFGYDPIFKPEGFDVSFAEMSREEKNSISHRGKAVKGLVGFLNNM